MVLHKVLFGVLLLTGLGVAVPVGLVGCDEDTSEQLEDAADEAGDAMEDAAEDVEEIVEEAADKVEDAVD